MTSRQSFSRVMALVIAVMTLLPMVLVAIYAAEYFQRLIYDREIHSLRSKALLIAPRMARALSRSTPQEAREMCQSVGQLISARVAIIRKNGAAFADSDNTAPFHANMATAPDIKKALNREEGTMIEINSQSQQEILVVAEPLLIGDQVIGAIRVSRPLNDVLRALRRFHWRCAITGVMFFVLAILVSAWLAKQVRSPIERLTAKVNALPDGERYDRGVNFKHEEFYGLSTAISKMARSLNDRITSITTKHNELKAILASMIEGVIAVDNDERLLTVNATAHRLLNVSISTVEGRYMHEVIRDAQIQNYVSKLLNGQEASEIEMALYRDEKTYLRMHGSPLIKPGGEAYGAVVVFTDITNIKKLENLRKDFVANVSHEIHTPLAAIKGSVETLVDGAIHDDANAWRFLNIIVKHTDRLNALVDDLLALSSIEAQYEKGQIALSKHSLRAALRGAVDLREETIRERGVKVSINCAENLTARINPTLIEQALVNFIDNAIRYGSCEERPCEITVNAWADNDKRFLSVKDNGEGVAKEHLPRLFERFYVADKGRSRKLGGTGLGLAIVKHIVQAHRGQVSVKSEIGKGSEFIISLPC